MIIVKTILVSSTAGRLALPVRQNVPVPLPRSVLPTDALAIGPLRQTWLLSKRRSNPSSPRSTSFSARPIKPLPPPLPAGIAPTWLPNYQTTLGLTLQTDSIMHPALMLNLPGSPANNSPRTGSIKSLFAVIPPTSWPSNTLHPMALTTLTPWVLSTSTLLRGLPPSPARTSTPTTSRLRNR